MSENIPKTVSVKGPALIAAECVKQPVSPAMTIGDLFYGLFMRNSRLEAPTFKGPQTPHISTSVRKHGHQK